MCKSAAATAAVLMKAIEPTIVQLLTLEGIANTPAGTSAINAFNAALTAVESWKSGTTSADVIQLINAFVAVFDTLPLPPTVQTLVSIITAGIEGVIAAITANSPAPVTTEGTTPVAADAAAEAEAVQTIHAHSVANAAEAKVTALTGYKPSTLDKARVALGDTALPAIKYKQVWNGAVDALTVQDAKYAALKV